MENKDIVFYAFRYALGRKTFAVQIVVDYLLKHWDDIPLDMQNGIKSEIKVAIIDGNAGMDMDVKQWEKLLTPPPEGGSK